MASLPVTLQELIELVDTSSGSPERLAAAVALSQELSGLGDELVGHFVEAARQDGCSWAQIGQQLGITRQAAQQRFVAPRERGPRIFERFGEAARRVVELAQHEARRLDHNYLGTEHLLLGLLARGEGVAAQALTDLGVSAHDVRARVKKIIGKGEPSAGGPIHLTPRSKKVLQLAVAEAKVMGDADVGIEHLLLGIVQEGEGVAAQILNDLGADEQRVRLQLSALLGRPCAPSRRRRRRNFGRAR